MRTRIMLILFSTALLAALLVRGGEPATEGALSRVEHATKAPERVQVKDLVPEIRVKEKLTKKSVPRVVAKGAKAHQPRIWLRNELLESRGFRFKDSSGRSFRALPVIGSKERFEVGGEQGTRFVGQVLDPSGSSAGTALLTTSGVGEQERYAGRISLDSGEVLLVGTDPAGNPTLETLDPASIPTTEGVAIVQGGSAGRLTPEQTIALLEEKLEARPVGELTKIDLLVVYSDLARKFAGSSEQIEATVQAAVLGTNVAYQDSGIAVDVRLVGLEEVEYEESGRFETELVRLREQDDGLLDQVHELRAAVKADVVTLIVEGRERCGLAFVLGSTNPGFKHFMFNVVSRHCALATLALAHELGHNLGAAHNVGSGAPGIFEFSHGHAFDRFQTIMSSIPGQVRVPVFSNPELRFDGFPTGIAEGAPDAADVVRTINLTSQVVAEFGDELE